MSEIMLHGVLNMPPELWNDASPIDVMQRHGRYVQASKYIDELERELAAVTEQRDELLRYNEAFRQDTLICADCDAISKEEYDRAIEQRDGLRSAVDYASDQLTRVTEQRDKYRDIASELIAMIRINVMRDTFKIATIEQVDEHLKPWIARIAAVKGGSDE